MSDDPTVTQLGSIKLNEPVQTPDVWDVLICGGGPCGTAAAMRAKELGLNALVLDYDDVMKRIRDYPKAKPILPTYGGGDKATFPGGEQLVQSLYFDDIDKDDLVAKWKQCYRAANAPARIGSELTGLESRSDGAWDVVTWNHRNGEEMKYVAKHVIVAVGAGVPRRFDIPGDTDGIAFRLDDPANYVSKGPILVIGGGTSAGEACIAISNAKMEAEDPCHVYWGYRGTKMPKVSKALADRFFDAYLGNGNVRYLRMSDPALVITGPDKKDYLSLLVDRKEIEGRPIESVHYEFAKECVIACIGTDLPVKLLQRLGIKVPMVNGQPRMLVNADGETNLQNVYLAGDARGPRFLRCTDFEDTETYEKVSLKRNIKAAMNDAVGVVEVIGRRLGVEVPELAEGPVRGPKEDGSAADPALADTAVEVEIPAAAKADAPAEAEAPPEAADAADDVVHTPASTHPAEQGGDAAAPVISTLLPDGEVEEEFPIRSDSIEIGRLGTGIACPNEQYMADHHATVQLSDGQWSVTDSGQGSGVWLRVQGMDGTVAHDGDQLWVGSQILVVNKTDQWVVTHYDREGRQGQTYAVQGKGFMVGRAVDLPLDPTDMLLGRRHCQFVLNGEELRIYDRGALNGTWLRVRETSPLTSGDEFKLATKRFRLENVAAVEKLEADAVVIDTPAEEPAAAAEPAAEAPAAEAEAAEAPAAAPAAGGAPSVAYTGEEGSMDWAVAEGQTILDAYLKAGGGQGSPLDYDCEKGICGACAVQINAGSEHFDPVEEGSTEMKTIQIAVGVEPDSSKYRLACLAKIKGPVTLGVPED